MLHIRATLFSSLKIRSNLFNFVQTSPRETSLSIVTEIPPDHNCERSTTLYYFHHLCEACVIIYCAFLYHELIPTCTTYNNQYTILCHFMKYILLYWHLFILNSFFKINFETFLCKVHTTKGLWINVFKVHTT